MKNISNLIEKVQNSLEVGFNSQAAKKRANDIINRVYGLVQNQVQDTILKSRNGGSFDEATDEDYWKLCVDLHHVKEHHFEIASKYSQNFEIVRDLLALRSAVKESEIVKIERDNKFEKKAEEVRKEIEKIAIDRKEQYLKGIELANLFGGLPVHVNSHLVYGHKGSIFVRNFYYYNGKLTPLNVILAIAEKYEEEKK